MQFPAANEVAYIINLIRETETICPVVLFVQFYLHNIGLCARRRKSFKHVLTWYPKGPNHRP